MLKVYNTLSRKVEEFKPINPPNVGMYTCGPTIYREVHIGNLRTYLLADFLRRTLEYNGFIVKHIKNITDVGHMRRPDVSGNEEQIDPVIQQALKTGKTPQEITNYYTDLFLRDEGKLNIKKAMVYSKASEHIGEMIEMIKVLLKKGLAYETNGTVYFDVKKFKNYGRLSGNTLAKMDNLLKAVRVSLETDKRDSIDFALWKKAEKGRLMKWQSPWGEGFPGWHIECSAMSMKYLGHHIDIHTGGEDLIFPHHEDEIAQSEGATGGKFVNYWVHGGHLLTNEEKMARSKGNVYTVSDIEQKGFEPLAFRYLTMTVHYKAKMNFTWEALEGAQKALNRLRDEVALFGDPKGDHIELEQKFLGAINDDLNMPEALAVVWELLKSGQPGSVKTTSLLKFDKVLGLGLNKVKSSSRFNRDKAQSLEIPEEIRELAEEREELRQKKRFHLADQLRNKIKKMGYEIEDSNGKSKITPLARGEQ